MIIRYYCYTIVWFVCAIIGVFIFPILPKKGGDIQWKWADNIWGNSSDTICGDFAYKANQGQAWYRRYWACWWWSCIRNPANNLLRHKLNAEGIISKIEKRGNLTIVTFKNGKRYFFYYNKGSRYVVKFGWRFWADQIKVGEYYNASFVCNP